MFKHLREELGWVYGLSCKITCADLFCCILGDAYTDPRHLEDFITQFKQTVDRFVQNGITQEELEIQKEKVSNELDLSTGPKIVDFLQSYRVLCSKPQQIIDLFQRIYGLTVHEVNRVIKQYFSSEKFIFVSTGKSTEKEVEKTDKVGEKVAKSQDNP